jgi:tartrate-resistant acid phosphatase type 5
VVGMQIDSASITSQVISSADDAEEDINTGSVSLTSSDLELGADAGVNQWVGMRFNNISIPSGAFILNAYVEFEVDETGSDPTSILIQGQASDNAPAFANTTANISSRSRTAAQVAWNSIPAWSALDAKWQTPDLSPIIQEIVSRPGWAAGNSMVIIASGSGRRTAESYDGEIPAAAKLVIQYTIGDTPTPDPNATPTATASPSPTGTMSRTPTPSATFAPGGTIRFAIIGDYGQSGSPELGVANRVKSWNPEFVITMGDNTYSSAIDQNIGQYYHEFIYPYIGSYGAGATNNLFFPSIGNHDWGESNGQLYFDYFTLPNNERYYDYVRGPVHFFVIDSDSHEPDGTSSSSTQALWLQARLAASTSAWNIVYFHHPPYSSSGSSSGMRWPFQAWGADIVLAGHRHNYERVMINGFPYLVNGLGGASIHSFGTPITGSVVRYNSDYGAMLVNASSSSVTFQFITRTGAVIDTYTLGTTVTATPTATRTPTPTASATATLGPSATPTATRTPTLSPTPTFTPTNTATPIDTATPSQTFTPSQTYTATNTPTITATPTATRTPSQTFTPAPTFTPTETRTPTSTQTATATHTPTSTPTSTATSASAPDLIFANGFESGDLSAWSSSSIDLGDLSVSSSAAVNGSYGLQAVIDDTNAIYVADESPNGETRYRARFYFDPNSISMASNDDYYIFSGYSGTSTLVLRMKFQYSGASYQLQAQLLNDSSIWTNSSWFTISDAPHFVEVDWRAATSSGANNGSLTFWIDGLQLANLTGVDNDTWRIDRVRLGATSGINSTTLGVTYLDTFESRRQTYIGP